MRTCVCVFVYVSVHEVAGMPKYARKGKRTFGVRHRLPPWLRWSLCHSWPCMPDWLSRPHPRPATEGQSYRPVPLHRFQVLPGTELKLFEQRVCRPWNHFLDLIILISAKEVNNVASDLVTAGARTWVCADDRWTRESAAPNHVCKGEGQTQALHTILWTQGLSLAWNSPRRLQYVEDGCLFQCWDYKYWRAELCLTCVLRRKQNSTDSF